MGTTYEKKVGRHYRKIIFLSAAALLIIGLLVFLMLFRVTTVKVTGNVHYTDQEIKDMVLTGPASNNTLLASWLKKHVTVKDVAFMDSVDVQMQDRNTLRLDVTEKAIVGCVTFEGAYYYFDKDGMVLEKTDAADVETSTGITAGEADAADDTTDSAAQGTDESDPGQDAPMTATDGKGTSDNSVIVATEVTDDGSSSDETVAAITPAEVDGATTDATEAADTANAVTPEEAVENYVPQIEGLVFSTATVGEVLPVEDTKVFNTINSLTKMINKNNIPPDQVTFDESGNLTLTYANARIALGADENLELKLQELTAILPKLADLSGVLHLENFDGTQSGIVFDKDVDEADAASEDTVSGDAASEDTASGDTASGDTASEDTAAEDNPSEDTTTDDTSPEDDSDSDSSLEE